ncbi:MAG: T9SS type A sorting domain-containing protein [Planctomycetes bacterium]|nr:T9SS type A sorting domain-containing protein [Planctomycetota bacterium]
MKSFGTILLVLCCLCLVMPAYGQAPPDGNLILNQSFESDWDNWDVWTSTGSDWNYSIETGQAFSGEKSMKFYGGDFDNGTVNWTAVAQHLYYTFEEGQLFNMSGYIMTTADDQIQGPNGAWVEIVFRQSDWTELLKVTSPRVDTTSTTDTWHYLTITAAVPAGTDFISAAILFEQAENAGGAAYCDSITAAVAYPVDVPNADFETGDLTSWSIWSYYYPIIEVSSDYAYEGTYSLRAAADYAAIYNTLSDPLQGNTYIATAYGLNPSIEPLTVGSTKLELKFFGGPSELQVFSELVDYNSPQDEWIEMMVTAEAPQATSVNVAFSWSGDNGGGAAYQDDVTLIRIPSGAAISAPPAPDFQDIEIYETTGIWQTIEWDVLHYYVTDDPEANEAGTYNLYASNSPITDVNADGVQRTAGGMPFGFEDRYWPQRPYTSDGSEQTYYYALTSVDVDGNEQALDAASTFGPYTGGTSHTYPVVHDEDFGDGFYLDGALDEFADLAEFVLTGEWIWSDDSSAVIQDWDPNSLDLAFQANFVIDANFMYVGVNILDDDPSGSSSWVSAGDGCEFMLGFYDVNERAALNPSGGAGSNGEDWRIGFMPDGQVMGTGITNDNYADYLDYWVEVTPIGWTLEVKFDLAALSNGYTPADGDFLPLRIDVLDSDPLFGDAGRSLAMRLGGCSGYIPNDWEWPSSYGNMEVGGDVAIEDERDTIASATKLFKNYPNPFNPRTTIGYTLANKSEVKLAVYNSSGQLVKTLVDEQQPAGPYSVDWDGSNNAGARVGSGIYFYKMEAGNYTKTHKMVLLK